MLSEFIILYNEDELSKEELALLKYLEDSSIVFTEYGVKGTYSIESGIFNLDRNKFIDKLKSRFKIEDIKMLNEIEIRVFNELWNVEIVKIHGTEYTEEGFIKFFESLYQDYINHESTFRDRLILYKLQLREE